MHRKRHSICKVWDQVPRCRGVLSDKENDWKNFYFIIYKRLHSFICYVYWFLSQFSSFHCVVLNCWPVLFFFSLNCSCWHFLQGKAAAGAFPLVLFVCKNVYFLFTLKDHFTRLGVLSQWLIFFAIFNITLHPFSLHVCTVSEEMPGLILTSAAWCSGSFLNLWFAICHQFEKSSVIIPSTFLVFLRVFSHGQGRELWYPHPLIRGPIPVL